MLSKRLARLEANRPAPGALPSLDLAGLAPDVVARVMLAKVGGTFPQSLCNADLQAPGALPPLDLAALPLMWWRA